MGAERFEPVIALGDGEPSAMLGESEEVACNLPSVEYGVAIAEHVLIRIYTLGSKT